VSATEIKPLCGSCSWQVFSFTVVGLQLQPSQYSWFHIQGSILYDASYETTHTWNSEPQNIEQEISNDEVWNRCAQSFFKIIMTEYLTSLFAFSEFLLIELGAF
jgi:hypothetical protein